MLNEVFLGKRSHWALWVLVAAVLYVAGQYYVHVRWFAWFSLLVLALSAGVVLYLVITHRPGERITREPFEGG